MTVPGLSNIIKVQAATDWIGSSGFGDASYALGANGILYYAGADYGGPSTFIPIMSNVIDILDNPVVGGQLFWITTDGHVYTNYENSYTETLIYNYAMTNKNTGQVITNAETFGSIWWGGYTLQLTDGSSLSYSPTTYGSSLFLPGFR
jgi:hypothetical protein